MSTEEPHGEDCDGDGYPTEEAVDRIAAYDLTIQPFEDFLELLRRNWSGYGSWKRTKTRLRLATGGWSGCEDVIGALQRNFVFQALCWQSSHRGGLHIYRVPLEITTPKGEWIFDDED